MRRMATTGFAGVLIDCFIDFTAKGHRVFTKLFDSFGNDGGIEQEVGFQFEARGLAPLRDPRRFLLSFLAFVPQSAQ